MSIDKGMLKALAEAANAVTTDVNITMAVGADPVEVKAVQDYLQVVMPKTILALLAEIETIRTEAKRQEDGLKEMLRRQNKQICALKGKRYD